MKQEQLHHMFGLVFGLAVGGVILASAVFASTHHLSAEESRKRDEHRVKMAQQAHDDGTHLYCNHDKESR
jgi:orotate phosphoribosyltransferase